MTKQLQTQTLDLQQSDHVLFTQPRDPNIKTKPAYKTYCSYCHRTNPSISARFKKRDDEDRRDAYARSESPQKSFVHYFRSSINDKTSRYDTRPNDYPNRFRSRSTSRNIRKITILNIDKDLHLELFIIMIEILLPHTTLDHIMIIIKEILAHIVHHTGLLIDHPTNVIHVPDTNLDRTPERTTSEIHFSI